MLPVTGKEQWFFLFYCDFTYFPTHILELIFSSSLDSKGILIYLNVQKLRVMFWSCIVSVIRKLAHLPRCVPESNNANG
jgi:hypothetical protein